MDNTISHLHLPNSPLPRCCTFWRCRGKRWWMSCLRCSCQWTAFKVCWPSWYVITLIDQMTHTGCIRDPDLLAQHACSTPTRPAQSPSPPIMPCYNTCMPSTLLRQVHIEIHPLMHANGCVDDIGEYLVCHLPFSPSVLPSFVHSSYCYTIFNGNTLCSIWVRPWPAHRWLVAHIYYTHRPGYSSSVRNTSSANNTVYTQFSWALSLAVHPTGVLFPLPHSSPSVPLICVFRLDTPIQPVFGRSFSQVEAQDGLHIRDLYFDTFKLIS